MRPWVDGDRSCWVETPRSDSDWQELADEYSPGPNGRPLRRVLEVAREGGARTVVIENRYVDIDYRSEYTAFWSLKFDNQSPFARRFHFFASDLVEEGLHRLTKRQQASYLGYSVIRPVPYGRVGRTVLAPPPQLGATLTTITDRISFFGHRLEVVGVPFCQQDAEYLRCAHASAWICHYVAARRGEVGRRPTADIVELSPTALSPERPLPSNGLNYNQLQVVFAELEQPAILYGMSLLPEVIGVENPLTPDQAVEGEPPVEPWLPPTPHGLWDTRMISIICRYLNSGFPVLIGTEGHAFVLVGWRRDDEGVVQFIACDDAVGPYEVISSPFEHYKTPWDAIMVPLPPRVFMSGESAENRAHKFFASLFAAAPKQLGNFEDELKDGRIELRTALRTGASFKEEIQRVTSSDEILSLVRNARLPHWVWVVEAHRRSVCDEEGRNCVVAAALFDSTAYDIDPPPDVLTMPGFVVVFPPDDAQPVFGDGSARPWGSLLEVH